MNLFKDTETEVFWGDLTKAAAAIVCLGRYNQNLTV